MNKVELLAPAKNKETAVEAVNCGADAVYIGAPAFGARQNASNSIEDIKSVVDYAHKFWVKVHVTVNTILNDSELDDAVKLVKELYNIGVDAVIIQDMGLLERLKDDSDIPVLHMSTQCNNYSPEKIKFFNDIGVKRVVLARELSIEQIREIHKQNPNLELECFIHGALCVSMSGQCYLSEYIGGRSANRGECAQPCRKSYDVIDDKGNIIANNVYALCLKDFNGSNYINDLINAGVTSFKIEGRLKDIGYVKNITSYYRALIQDKTSSGKSMTPFVPNPEKTFNRGFTDYFLNGRSECFSIDSPKSKGEFIGIVTKTSNNYFSVNTSKELHPQDGLFIEGFGCLVNKVIKNKKESLIYPNKIIKIKCGDKVYRNLDVKFEKELLQPVKRQIGVSLLINNEVILTDEDGITASFDLPKGEIPKNQEKAKDVFIKQMNKTGESDFYIENIEVSNDIVIPFLPVSAINEFRRFTFDKLMSKRLEYYNKSRQKQPRLSYAKYYEDNIDYRGNVHNEFAKQFYEKCGAKVVEYSFEKQKPTRSVELMHCKHCIKFALNMCKSPKKLFLRDSHGINYPLKFDCASCQMFVMKP